MSCDDPVPLNTKCQSRSKKKKSASFNLGGYLLKGGQGTDEGVS